MIVNVALACMLVLSVFALWLLSWYSISGTYLIRGFLWLDTVFIPDRPIIKAGLFLVTAAGLIPLSVAVCRLKDRGEALSRYVLYAVSVCSLLLGFFYVAAHPYYMDGDQIITFYAGVYARYEGSVHQFSMFSPGGYMSIYPQQKGLAFFYYLLYPFLKDDMFICLQFLHLIYPQMILYCGYLILRTEKVSPFGRILFNITYLGCIPLILYLPYMYGDLGSVAFSFSAILFLVRYIGGSHIRDAVFMCMSVSAALLMRKQIWIFIAALVIVLVLEAVRTVKIRFVVLALCTVLAAGMSFKGIDAFFASRSGYESSRGVPSVCWLVMGLQETNGFPGIYNRYNQSVYEENGFDPEMAKAEACADLRERMEYFASNGVYARSFFAAKLRQEWTAPDFEALSSTRVWDPRSGRDTENVAGWLVSLYSGVRYGQMMTLADVYQSMVYLGAFLGAVVLLFKKKKDIPVSLILAYTYLLGGFIFFAFWENKSRYVMPFFVCLLLTLPFLADELSRIPARTGNPAAGPRHGKG